MTRVTYPTDLTDVEWTLAAPYLATSGYGRPPLPAKRALLNAIFEVVQLRWTVQGIKLKKLLRSVIRCLIINAGVQALVIIVIKIVGDAGLGVG